MFSFLTLSVGLGFGFPFSMLQQSKDAALGFALIALS